jgi:hypothetical protein
VTALDEHVEVERPCALSTNETAVHSAVISAEREVVTKHFTLLLGPEPPHRRASDNGSIRSGKQPLDVR